ncbi:MAG: hypothetical protein ACJ70T_03400 [Nitrososphaera sp.]
MKSFFMPIALFCIENFLLGSIIVKSLQVDDAFPGTHFHILSHLAVEGRAFARDRADNLFFLNGLTNDLYSAAHTNFDGNVHCADLLFYNDWPQKGVEVAN